MSALLRIFGFSKPEITKNHTHGMTDENKDRIAYEAETVRLHFDETYYLLHNPDVAEAKFDPLLHFLIYGWKEGRDPNGSFSVRYYLDSNQDVLGAGVNPFWHYLVAGKSEGRQPTRPGEDPVSAETSQEVVSNVDPEEDRRAAERETIRSHFDSAYYLRYNSDVAASNLDPLTHFLETGWKEGRNPNAAFSVEYYLEANPDVRTAGVNPFWHYVVAGKAEGRAARHPGGFRAEILMHTQPLEEMVKAWRSRPAPNALIGTDDILRGIVDATIEAQDTLIVSIGHDNYRAVSGGVQYCIQHEEEAATDRGIVYLNLHPYQPLPRLAHGDEESDLPVSLLLDGKAIGVATMSAVTEAVGKLAGQFATVETIIHHFLGHSPEQIADMIRATGNERCRLWLHDFFTLCPNFVLQRNNVSFCGAPPVESNACTLCLYGTERIDHLKRMGAFFDGIEVDIIAPSQFAADFWRAGSGLSASSITVLPHAAIEWVEHEPREEEDGKITVAFIGYPAPHKGWPVFENIVRTFRGDDSEFKFVYFGTSPIGLDQVDTVRVHVTAEEPDAMINALRERQVDFVLHWASCAETFSFSTHEAITAGAYVLTNPGSGNVAATVNRLERGAVLTDESDLEAFFRDGRSERLVGELRAKRRAQTAHLSRSEMSLDILKSEHSQ